MKFFILTSILFFHLTSNGQKDTLTFGDTCEYFLDLNPNKTFFLYSVNYEYGDGMDCYGLPFFFQARGQYAYKADTLILTKVISKEHSTVRKTYYFKKDNKLTFIKESFLNWEKFFVSWKKEHPDFVDDNKNSEEFQNRTPICGDLILIKKTAGNSN